MGKVIAICNQKGGVGKTTTTVSLGVGLARHRNKVLLIDMDPQGDLSTSLGYYNTYSLKYTISSLIDYTRSNREYDISEAIQTHPEGIDVITSNIDLSTTEMQLASALGRESILKSIISPIRNSYDYILIDCMPSLGMITVNALTAADSVIIPVQAQYLPAKGMTQLLSTINQVKGILNEKLEIEGVLITLADRRTNLAKETATIIRDNFGQYINIFESEIPIAIKAAETSAHAKSIFEYDIHGTVATAYENLSREVEANVKRMGFSATISTEQSIFEAGTERQ